MKKLSVILLSILMLFTLIGCNSKQDTPIVEEKQEEVAGGYVDVEDGNITDKLLAIFNSAMEDYEGMKLEPIRLLQTQVVAGTNYKFLANASPIILNPKTKKVIVTIYEDLQGNASITNVLNLEDDEPVIEDEKPKTYIITVNDDTNGKALANHSEAKQGDKISVIASANDGYAFDSWISNVEIKNNTFIMPDYNVVIQPSFTKVSPQVVTVDKCYVAFDLQGKGDITIVSVNKGSKVSKPADPTAQNLSFKGWYLADAPFDFDNQTISSDTIICAHWAGNGLPNSGSMIKLDGKDDLYKVVKINGTVAEVMTMASSKKAFNNPSKTTTVGSYTIQEFNGSTIDQYLNGTYYDSLSTNIKNAIIKQTFAQDIYTSVASTDEYDYIYQCGFNTNNYLKYNESVEVGERSIYTLNVGDLLDCLKDCEDDNYFSSDDINIFYFGSQGHNTKVLADIWTASGVGNDSGAAWSISGYGGMWPDACTGSYQVRPVFTIDLSKVSFVIAK